MRSNMITLANVYHVLEATLPLYAVMILAYLSIKLWKIFTPDQCSGINRFVAKFSIPLLSFHVISTNNPYQMNLKLLLSDTIQKLLSLLIFAVLCKICFNGNIDWLITGFSLSTLPNTLVVGIPLLTGMYGVDAAGPLGQIVVLQSLIWYAVLLFLFEYRAATIVPTTANGDAEQDTATHEEEVRVSSSKHRSLHILLIAGRKLATNPNTCSSLAGLVWALISFRWRVQLPRIIGNSISLISDGGLGMAMFSLGLFTASQSKIIACGTRMMVLCIGLRFIIGPALMAAPSYVSGLRNKLLDVAVVQAALPQGIVPFVLAKEYGLHPDILSTGVIIGMALALPVGLGYYFLLDPH